MALEGSAPATDSTTEATKKSSTKKATTAKATKTTATANCHHGQNGFYAVKGTQCTRFYRCVNGAVYYFNCPPGTFFDVRYSTCNNMNEFYCPN